MYINNLIYDRIFFSLSLQASVLDPKTIHTQPVLCVHLNGVHRTHSAQAHISHTPRHK